MTTWYYENKDGQQGPVSEDEIGELLQDRTIDSSCRVWSDGLPDWVEIQNSELKGLISSEPPPLKPAGPPPLKTPASSAKNQGPGPGMSLVKTSLLVVAALIFIVVFFAVGISVKLANRPTLDASSLPKMGSSIQKMVKPLNAEYKARFSQHAVIMLEAGPEASRELHGLNASEIIESFAEKFHPERSIYPSFIKKMEGGRCPTCSSSSPGFLQCPGCDGVGTVHGMGPCDVCNGKKAVVCPTCTGRGRLH